MIKYLILISLLVPFCLLNAQFQRAIVNDDGSMRVVDVPAISSSNLRDGDTFQQLAGFPKGAIGSNQVKNFRNISIADINNDGQLEILFTANNRFLVYNANGLLWEKSVTGIGSYPPTIADVNGDGALDIVFNTVGQSGAKIYILDKDGNDFTDWPVSLNDNWIVASVAVSDLDNDGNMEIIANEILESAGRTHILKLDGSPFNSNWPVSLDRRPAITPSIGDIDNDGQKDIISISTRTIYVFDLNGQTKSGWPLINENTWFSFQSPILVDLDNDDDLEIVGSAHGDSPEYYVLEHDGTYANGWPKSVANNSWTFSTPTIIPKDNSYQIIMSKRTENDSVEDDYIFSWTPDGSTIDNFPISKIGGVEGILSIADVDNDGEFEIIFGSDLINNGHGFIHAFEMDGSGEVDGFPICPKGWTILNGASIDDVNGDGMMDLVALTYTQNFGAATDSVFLNVYDLQVPYSPEKVLWSTYKGSNSRDGLIAEDIMSGIFSPELALDIELNIAPNPATSFSNLALDVKQTDDYRIQLIDSNGRWIRSIFDGQLQNGVSHFKISMEDLPSAIYYIVIKNKEGKILSTKLVNYN